MAGTISIIKSEFTKIKTTPLPLMLLVAIMMIVFMTTMATVLDIHNVAKIDVSTWKQYMHGSIAIYSVFILSPIVILFVSGLSFIESRARGWKYLYTTPHHRAKFYFSKLAVIIISILFLTMLLIGLLLVTAYIINIFYPECEFTYYSPNLTIHVEKLAHVLIACLGIIGLQYLLSYLFNHFLIPLGMGLFCFVVGIIMSATNISYSLYNPFTFPMLAIDQGMFRFDHRTEAWEGSWLSNVEVNSIIVFLVCIAIGYLYERRKNIL